MGRKFRKKIPSMMYDEVLDKYRSCNNDDIEILWDELRNRIALRNRKNKEKKRKQKQQTRKLKKLSRKERMAWKQHRMDKAVLSRYGSESKRVVLDLFELLGISKDELNPWRFESKFYPAFKFSKKPKRQPKKSRYFRTKFL